MSEYEGPVTYRKLRDWLNTLSDKELEVPVQVYNPNPNGDIPVELLEVISLGTVGYFFGEDDEVPSVHDGKKHPEDPVLLTDYNSFYKIPRRKKNKSQDAAKNDQGGSHEDDTRSGAPLQKADRREDQQGGQ